MSDFNIGSIYLVSTTADGTFIGQYDGRYNDTLRFTNQHDRYIYCNLRTVREYTELSSYTYDIGELE